MCPPPRRLALEANGCFMVQVPREPHRIQGCGAIIAPPKAISPRNTGDIDRGTSTLDPTARNRAERQRRTCLWKTLDSGIPIQGHAYGKRLTLESPYKLPPDLSRPAAVFGTPPSTGTPRNAPMDRRRHGRRSPFCQLAQVHFAGAKARFTVHQTDGRIRLHHSSPTPLGEGERAVAPDGCARFHEGPSSQEKCCAEGRQVKPTSPIET